MAATSDTFNRLARANPDRVGRSGVFAELDSYQVAVINYTCDGAYTWVLRHHDRHVTSGETGGLVAAWQAGCDALDDHRAALEAVG